MTQTGGNEAENPYGTPRTQGGRPAKRKRPGWHPLTWTIVGFAGGTIAVAPFILSIEPRERIKAGMMFGGPLGAVASLGHGFARRRKQEQD
ncbi:MAG: hypothetical protein WD847_06445 [Pirellulales bacterium]